jgi:hypothetical protein
MGAGLFLLIHPVIFYLKFDRQRVTNAIMMYSHHYSIAYSTETIMDTLALVFIFNFSSKV